MLYCGDVGQKFQGWYAPPLLYGKKWSTCIPSIGIGAPSRSHNSLNWYSQRLRPSSQGLALASRKLRVKIAVAIKRGIMGVCC